MSWTPCPDAESSSPPSPQLVKAVIVPRSVDLGGMKVSRVLPARNGQMVGPFIFVDQMGPTRLSRGQGLDVLPHPHINLATLTYLLEGELIHRDSLGSRQRILPGAVNWMQAGSGIVHSERSSQEDRSGERTLLGFQTWVALPEPAEESAPRFIHHGSSEIPVVEDGGIRARVLAGDGFGAASPLETASATMCIDVAANAGTRIPVPEHFVERAAYVLQGELDIGGSAFQAGKLLILAPDEAIALHATKDTRVMLFGGEPMDGPRYIWWNFVSSRAERIRQAQEDWLEGNFPNIPDDMDESTPLPAQETSPRRIHPQSAGQ